MSRQVDSLAESQSTASTRGVVSSLLGLLLGQPEQP